VRQDFKTEIARRKERDELLGKRKEGTLHHKAERGGKSGSSWGLPERRIEGGRVSRGKKKERGGTGKSLYRIA